MTPDDAGGDGERLFPEQRERLERPVLRLFADYGTDRRLLLAVALASTVLGPVLSLAPTFVLKVTIDGALFQSAPYAYPLVPDAWLPSARFPQILVSAGLIAATATLSAGATRVDTMAWNLYAQEVQHAVRTDAFGKLQRLGMSFFTAQRTGQLLSVINSDVNELEDLLRDLVRNLLGVGVRLVGIAAVMAFMNWQLALVALVPIPVLALLSHRYSRLLREAYADVRSSVGVLTSRIENSVDGITIVKAYTNEAMENDRVAEASEEYLDSNWDAAVTRSKLFPTMQAVNWYGFGVILLVGGLWIVDGPPGPFTGGLTVGTLVAFLTYNQQFTMPLVQMGRLVDLYYDARASAERVFSLMDYPVDVRDADDGVALESVDGRVEYDGVDFAYPGADDRVLRGVSATVEPGQTLGLVGRTGAGKTTFVKLLPRFYDPDRGTVRLDGHDLQDVTVGSLRDAIGYVGQDPFLFDGTVAANIGYGDPDAGEDAIRDAARTAGAHEFVRDLDDEYDTRVGERGVKLSGGQRQRIALARAVLHDPEILVLDEATSHVDNETEALIQRNLRDIVADRTTFVIAHRLSTVRDADAILVIDDGEVAERGTHDELVAADGLYASLWRVQVGEVEGAVDGLLGRHD